MILPVRYLVAGMMLAVVGFPVSARAQGDLPVVGIEVDIQADLYRNELSSFIDQIETDLQQAVVDHLRSYDALGFVRWAMFDAQPHALRIVVEGVSGGLGTEIHMRFFRQVNGASNDLTDQNLEYFNPTVFDGFDQKYAQDPNRLTSELKNWLRAHMNEPFVDALKVYFLNDIALASSVHLDEIGRRLIVPLRFSALNPRKESKFRVDFVSNQIGDPRDGTINLNLTGKGRIPNFSDDGLDCEISVFKYPTVTAVSAESASSHWEEIKSILDDDHLIELMLFMEDYIPSFFPNTSGRLAMDGPPSL